MNAKFKSLVAAAAFIATQAAMAAPVSLRAGITPYKGVTISGQNTWAADKTLVNLLNLFGAQETAVAPGTLALTQSTIPGRVLGLSLNAPITSLVVESTTDQALSIATTGGMTITTVADDATNTGGNVTLSNLDVDLANKVVYADISGGNGITALKHVALWSFVNTTGLRVPTTVGGPWQLAISGLAIQPEALSALSLGLGLNDFGQTAINSIKSYGSLNLALLAAPAPACAVSIKATPTGTRPTYLATQVTVSNNEVLDAAPWAIKWSYPQPVILNGVKGATITRNDARTYTAKPAKGGSTVVTGQGRTSFSFNAYYSGTAPVATVLSATLGGATCAVVQP